MKTVQEDLRQYRDELKGLAMLWILFFHGQFGLTGLLYDIQKIGYGGVDLFFFLSGFGLCRSLQRDDDLGSYLKRRFHRLALPYGLFLVLWLAVMLPLGGYGVGQALRIALGNGLMIGLFAGIEPLINWYPGGLLLTILLAPGLYACFQKSTHSWKTCVLLILVELAAGYCLEGQEALTAVSRLPVFTLGMFMALPNDHKSTDEHPAARLVLSLVALVAGLGVLFLCYARKPDWLYSRGMYWYPMMAVAPALCALLGALLRRTKGSSLLRWIGKASFGIFLFNAWMEYLGKKVLMWKNPWLWLAGTALSLLLGLGWHVGMERLQRRKKS